ncbi:ubiquitin-specific protease 12, partial [Striga asiatica]
MEKRAFFVLAVAFAAVTIFSSSSTVVSHAGDPLKSIFDCIPLNFAIDYSSQSVGFTGSAAFIIAVLWLVSFGLALVVLYCCGWKIDLNGKESSWPHRICLWLLLLLTSAAARSALITVTAVMLVISILGFGICVISGWLLVTVTFILCGVFVILNNTITDTCMAMGEWVENPHAETALSNILPCVDQKTTNQTLFKSKQVINDIVNMVNGFVDSVANSNPPPQAGGPVYYNQSGPSIPHLCYLYDSNLQDRNCSDQELSMQNASLVWENYTCLASADGLCTTVGRLTPKMYAELVAAVNVSYALQHYAPPLLSLQNCDFVRDTFVKITSGYCPPLEHHLRTVNVGLALISVGVMLSLILWIIYANRPQREDVFAGIAFRLRIGSCGGKNNNNNNN